MTISEKIEGSVLVFKKEVDCLKEELEDHLTSINENTNEIETNYSYLMDIDQRLTLLEKKVNGIFDMLAQITRSNIKQTNTKIRITEPEQELFMIFYTADKALDYAFLCEKLNKSESYVRNCLNSLITKGVPIKRLNIKHKAYFLLDAAFKELQAKKNILNLSKTLTLDCFDQKVLEK